MIYKKRLVKAYIRKQAPEMRRRILLLLTTLSLIGIIGIAGATDQKGYCSANSYRCINK